MSCCGCNNNDPEFIEHVAPTLLTWKTDRLRYRGALGHCWLVKRVVILENALRRSYGIETQWDGRYGANMGGNVRSCDARREKLRLVGRGN